MTGSAELIKKLQIKAGARLRLINVPPPIAKMLTAGAEVGVAKADEPCTGVIAFADTPVEVERLTRQALAVISPDGLLWFAYRKGAVAKTSGLSRDHGWEPLRAAGWDTVRSVSIDDEWTGLRFRPAELIKR